MRLYGNRNKIMFNKPAKNCSLVWKLFLLLLTVCNSKTLESGNFASESSECNSLVIVSTLDGFLSVLDASKNGKVLWSLATNQLPLLQSTLNNIEVVSGGLSFRLLPSLDGSLYMYNEIVTQGIPLSVDSLLSSSTKIGDDVIVGSKDIVTYGVDAKTGKIYYSCSSYGCENFVTPNNADKLVIRRVSQIVRAVDLSTGNERWNVTVGEHQLFLSNADVKSMFNSKINYDQACINSNIQIRVIPPEGIVYATLKNNLEGVLWQQKFQSPIAKIWLLNKNNLEELSLFDPNVVPALENFVETASSEFHPTIESMIYMGYYGSQRYIIPSEEERHLLQLYSQSHMASTVPGRLYLATLAGHSYNLPLLESENTNCPSGGEHCSLCSASDVSTILQEKQSPNSGWYLYNLKSGSALQKWKQWDQEFSSMSEARNRNSLSLVDVWDWWKHALLLCVVVAIIPQIILFSYVFRKFTETEKKESRSRTTSVTTKSQESMTDLQQFTNEIKSEFSSRFLKDFIPVRCLGCGGFGTVYESVNKVDEQKYAVKRIALPEREYAKEKVIREVKALAKLDHPGIVRYYNSWFEEPPLEWLDSLEASVFKKCGSSCLSTGENMPYGKCHGEFETLSDCRISGGQQSNKTTSTPYNSKHHWPRFYKEESSAMFNDADVDLTGKISSSQDNDNQENSLEIVFQNSGDQSLDSQNLKIESSKLKQLTSLRLSFLQSLPSSRSKNKKHNKELQTPTCVGKAFLFIQMQLCQQDTLMDWLNENNTGKRDESLMLDWFRQTLLAMEYVHDCGMIHRDLKPTNIFFSLTGQVKIGDFGLAKECFSCEHCEDTADTLPLSTSGSNSCIHTENVGTYLYMSPEQETKFAYTFKVDIYALGLIFVELMIPFSTQMERVTILKNLRKLKLPNAISDCPIKSTFVKKLLSHSADERPTCKEILQSELFISVAVRS
ncbi:Eukaryotic translation initiation factor 2-alpha kinase 3 [Trichinella pseudospiralis]|uniref:non-specific serine/threonine protein kinase n=1 Tax=Trichinella pseudospiralis TaxID=6337 RepID=A0A0V1DXD7_TRIPS|nr:Eukaryotic translation initiation factor 2-alpha kinase 3 [Trichinella pseudospiralis]